MQQFIISNHKIPLSVPLLFGHEWRYVKKCFTTGWVSSGGQYVEQFEEAIRQYCHANHATACINGTAALHIALKIAGVNPHDEVIVPTLTFIAAANAVRYVNAEPIFMDCDQYYNLHIEKTIEFITSNTVLKKGYAYNKISGRRISALIPVHVLGNAVDLEELVLACRKRNIAVIEDATESLGTKYRRGKYRGRYTGTIGRVGCLSFNGNKIITTGGGGMILTSDSHLAKMAQYLTTQAKDDSLRYIHNAIGYNFRLNNIQAAFGIAQLQRLPNILKIKEKNYRVYKKHIGTINGLKMGDVPGYARNNHWMYALQINKKKYGRSKDELIRLFNRENIEVRPLWYLNHLQKPYQRNQSYKIENAYKMWKTTLNIPCSAGLKESEIKKVVSLLKKWKK